MVANLDPHASCYHRRTSLGDTFGGLGTSREYREEDVWAAREQPEREPDRPARPSETRA